MSDGAEYSSPPLAIALGLALIAGIVVAWTPHAWRVAVAMAAISLVAVFWAVTARHIRLPPMTIPVALIGIWGFVQLLFGASVIRYSTLRSSIAWAMSAVAFILGSQILRDRHARRAFLDLMLWASTALAVLAMLQTYTSPGHVLWIFPAGPTVMGTFYYRNQFAALMEIAAPIALWQVQRENVAIGGICYAAIFAATLTSTSRSGLILVTGELIVFLAYMVFQRRMPWKSAASVIAVMILLVAGAATIAGTEKTLVRFQEPGLYELRGKLVDSTLKLVAQHPWKGFGLGTWRAVYPRFATFDIALLANEAHNDWIQWAAEGGIPFFLLFAVIAIWLVKPSVRSVWGLGVPIVLVHSYADYPLREPAIAFLWFVIAGAVTQVSDRRAAPPRKEDRLQDHQTGFAALKK